MAPTDPFDRFPTPPHTSIPDNGIDGVLAAARMKAALADKQPAERCPVEHHHRNEESLHHVKRNS
jgi:hypothetical protein